MQGRQQQPRRATLTKATVLAAAVALADKAGIDTVSMRNLAQELRVVPMALYKHIANKEELVDGMVDAIIAEIDPPMIGSGWKTAVRQRILSARQVLLRHPWASAAIATRTRPSPTALAYLDSLIGEFRDGGLSAQLVHQAMHALGSRSWGFNLEVFPSPPPPPDPVERGAMLSAMAAAHPRILEIALASSHDTAQIVGSGCDDQFEFEFGLDLLLDGIERLHADGGGLPPYLGVNLPHQ